MKIERKEGETWRETVARYAGHYGLQDDCNRSFDEYLADGMSPDAAAWCALSEWDCIGLHEISLT